MIHIISKNLSKLVYIINVLLPFCPAGVRLKKKKLYSRYINWPESMFYIISFDDQSRLFAEKQSCSQCKVFPSAPLPFDTCIRKYL